MAGFFKLKDVLLTITGQKTAAFLHGQLTNSIKILKELEGNYNLLLTPKGKIVSDMFVFLWNHEFHLLVNPLFAQTVEDHLQKIALLSRVTVTNRKDKFFLCHILFDEAVPDVLLPLKNLEKYQVGTFVEGSLPLVCFRSDRLGVTGCDVLMDRQYERTFEDFLLQQNAGPLSEDETEILRVENAVCKVGVDATEDNLPQESRLDHALHFDKGCYVGQEVVARLHYKGHVNKILILLKIEGKEIVPPGTSLFLEGKKVGKITSCVYSESRECALALGYVPYKSPKGVSLLQTSSGIQVQIV